MRRRGVGFVGSECKVSLVDGLVVDARGRRREEGSGG